MKGSRVEAWNPEWPYVGVFKPDLTVADKAILSIPTGLRGVVQVDDNEILDVLWDDGYRCLVWKHMTRKLSVLELIAEAAYDPATDRKSTRDRLLEG